ncbi:unnamed protein product [Peronospora belbahrii]|uniref:CCHC-type domain-containing protein n=1 Tax=Peronospora belbahrii TaxID=622444 RepID=A0AAU9L851_9STRA|nr:unnamed protein product [Peronospora belbahrii]
MKMLSFLTVRSQLLCSRVRSPCNILASHSLGNNVNVNFVHLNRLQASKSCVFSTFLRSKDKSDQDKYGTGLNARNATEQTIDSGMNPLERLLHHSKEFRLYKDKESKNKQGDETDSDGSSQPLISSWQMDNRRRRNNSLISHHATDVSNFNEPRRRGNAVHHGKLGKMAVDRLVEKDMDEINYDAELENVWEEEQVKQRKFHRALRREHDKDHVCTNCGERGHRARNCLVPRICSNCGNLGHAARQCRFRQNPDTVDEFLMQELDIQMKKKKKRKLKETAAKAVKNPGMPLPKEVPTSELNKRNESLRKELEEELDAYADILEEQARKRRELKEKKEAQRENAKLSEK